MKNLPNTLIILAAVSAVLWVICRLTGIIIPVAGTSPIGLFRLMVLLLLFAIALSVKKGE